MDVQLANQTSNQSGTDKRHLQKWPKIFLLHINVTPLPDRINRRPIILLLVLDILFL